MRVTRKGQVTIPKHIRDKLGIEPGSEVRFVDKGAEGVGLEPATTQDGPPPASFDQWLAQVRGTIDLEDRPVDEIMIEIRGARDDLDAR